MKLIHQLIRSILVQTIAFIIVIYGISMVYSAYTSLSAWQIATGQPVSNTLMQQIKDNLDDLNNRISWVTSIPSGAVIAFNLWSCPAWWVAANGANGTRDLRWEFVRWLDSGRWVDSGRVLGTSQTDAFQWAWQKTRYNGTNGQVTTSLNSGGQGWYIASGLNGANGEFMGTTNDYYNIGYWIPRVSTETRPRNVALLYCQKQ